MKFQNFAIVKLEKQKNNFLVDKISKEIVNKDKIILKDALPRNRLSEVTVKQIRTESKKTILSVTKLAQVGDLEGLAFILEYSKIEENPFCYITSILKILKDYDAKMKFPKDGLEIEASQPREESLKGYKRIDIAAFSLLALLPTIVIGDVKKRLKFIAAIEELVPPLLVAKSRFTTQCTDITTDIAYYDIMGVDATAESLFAIDSVIKQGNHPCVVDVDTKEIYGPYTCPMTRKFAQIIFREAMPREKKKSMFHLIIEELFHMAIESDVMVDVRDLAALKKIPYGDAMLLLHLRANNYNLPRPEDVKGFSKY